MQPYFLPYIGYFQLINMVDEFVVYDNIEFTKKGWIHRNQILQNGEGVYFTLPIKKDSDFLDINHRFLADSFEKEKFKFLRRIESNYRKAPFFDNFYPLLEDIFLHAQSNLFEFILNSIKVVNAYLGIKTPLIISSELGEEIRQLKSQDKVLAICKKTEAQKYINSSGGISLYTKHDFESQNIDLRFYKTNLIKYRQYENEFVPNLSIIDVAMFNSIESVRAFLNEFNELG